MDHTYTAFSCHRSGIFKSQAKWELKQLKAQGSARIGYHSTASIIMKEYESHTEVSYYAQHYKHEMDVKYIPIPKEEKEVIAGIIFVL